MKRRASPLSAHDKSEPTRSFEKKQLNDKMKEGEEGGGSISLYSRQRFIIAALFSFARGDDGDKHLLPPAAAQTARGDYCFDCALTTKASSLGGGAGRGGHKYVIMIMLLDHD